MMRNHIISALGAASLVFSGTSAFAQTASNAFGPSTEYTSTAFYGGVATLLGDVNGDGKTDAVAFNGGNTWVMLSNGSSFGPSTEFSSGAFQGEGPHAATLLGDVNGDGKADAVAFDGNSSWVMFSTGSSFGPSTLYSSGAFYGTVATLLGDVDGDGRADAVAFDGGSTWVMLSTPWGFGPSTEYSSGPFSGSVATLLGDVNGDGKADAVAFDGGSTYVMLSNGTSFGPSTLFSSVPFSGNVSTTLADVNGDGKVDAVAFDGHSTWVMLSNGSAFGASTLYSESAFEGSFGTLLGDVNGDRKADAVALDGNSTWVMLSTSLPSSYTYTWGEDDFGGGGIHSVSLTVRSDGSYVYSGQFWENTFPGCNPGVSDATIVALQAANGDVLTFSHSGSMSGCGSQNDDWTITGTNPQIANEWVGLVPSQGGSAVQESNLSVSLTNLWAAISGALSAISTVFTVVGALD